MIDTWQEVFFSGFFSKSPPTFCLKGIFAGTTGDPAQKELKSMAKKDDRIILTLACGDCKRRNYTTMKNKKNDPDRLNISKYCRHCKKHVEHKETKK